MCVFTLSFPRKYLKFRAQVKSAKTSTLRDSYESMLDSFDLIVANRSKPTFLTSHFAPLLDHFISPHSRMDKVHLINQITCPGMCSWHDLIYICYKLAVAVENLEKISLRCYSTIYMNALITLLHSSDIDNVFYLIGTENQVEHFNNVKRQIYDTRIVKTSIDKPTWWSGGID